MRKLVAGLVALGLLGGCQAVGDAYHSVFGGGGPVEKPAPLVAFTPKVQLRVLWHANVGPAGRSIFVPAVAGNAVFAAGAQGDVAAIQANTGKILTSFKAGKSLSAGVGSNGSMILVATNDGTVLAYNLHGKLLWRLPLNTEILAPPAIEGATVVVRTTDGHIYGVDAADGTRRWVYERSTPALSLRADSGVLLDHGAVFAGFADGRLVALSLKTGAVGWDSVVAVPHGTTDVERLIDVVGLPAVTGRQVCAVAYQGRAACFDLQSGTTDWAHKMSSVVGLAADNRNVYVTNQENAVVALDVVNGGSAWKQAKLFGRSVTAPLALGPYVIVGDYQGYVHVLSRSDGSFVGRIATDGSAIMAPPIALDSRTLVVQTKKGGVYAISLQ